jgi:hypothetical protein
VDYRSKLLMAAGLLVAIVGLFVLAAWIPEPSAPTRRPVADRMCERGLPSSRRFGLGGPLVLGIESSSLVLRLREIDAVGLADDPPDGPPVSDRLRVRAAIRRVISDLQRVERWSRRANRARLSSALRALAADSGAQVRVVSNARLPRCAELLSELSADAQRAAL